MIAVNSAEEKTEIQKIQEHLYSEINVKSIKLIDDESVVDEDQDILDVGNIEDVLGDGCDLC